MNNHTTFRLRCLTIPVLLYGCSQMQLAEPSGASNAVNEYNLGHPWACPTCSMVDIL